jgi:hypothetical protein
MPNFRARAASTLSGAFPGPPRVPGAQDDQVCIPAARCADAQPVIRREDLIMLTVEPGGDGSSSISVAAARL